MRDSRSLEPRGIRGRRRVRGDPSPPLRAGARRALWRLLRTSGKTADLGLRSGPPGALDIDIGTPSGYPIQASRRPLRSAPRIARRPAKPLGNVWKGWVEDPAGTSTFCGSAGDGSHSSGRSPRPSWRDVGNPALSDDPSTGARRSSPHRPAAELPLTKPLTTHDWVALHDFDPPLLRR
jgi:hypothetical protein